MIIQRLIASYLYALNNLSSNKISFHFIIKYPTKYLENIFYLRIF